MLAPPQAHPVVREFLGDVSFQGLGSAGPRQASAGPLLAVEYVRRAITVGVRKTPRVDVVAAASHFLPDAAAIASFARRGAFGVGYVYHLVAARPVRGLRTVWSKNDERIGLALLRRSAAVIFVSNTRTAAALRARGFDPVPTSIGIDLSSFPRRNPGGLPPRGVFLARMTHTKGVRDAIEVWARVRRSVPDAQLVMVGSGPEGEPAAALAASLGIADAVAWRGFVPEAEKRRILGESSLLLAPSYEEGWGIAVCEALASGVPVVGYRHEVLDEVFGTAYVGVRAGDIHGLADAALRVLTDDAFAERLSQVGRETAERYDVGRVAEQELETILRAKCGS